jgi:hypothetical protein
MILAMQRHDPSMHFPARDGIRGVWQPVHPGMVMVRRFGAVTLAARPKNDLGPAPFWRCHWYGDEVQVGSMQFGSDQSSWVVLPPGWSGRRRLARPTPHRYLHVDVPWLNQRQLSEQAQLMVLADADSRRGGTLRMRLSSMVVLGYHSNYACMALRAL